MASRLVLKAREGLYTVSGSTETLIIDNDGNFDMSSATFTGNVTIGDAGTDTLSLVALTTVGTNQKIQFRDNGIYINSGADGKLSIVADGTGADDITLSGSVTTSDTMLLGGKLTLYKIGSAAESASGLLMGVGTTANPALSSTASAIFAEFRTKCSATSGDSRGLYWRHEISGAAGGGEAVRAFAKVTAAASTVRGAHISIDLSTAGSVSGFGAGVDAQVMLDNTSYASKLTSLNAEIYAGGASTALAANNASFLRCVVSGDGTGVADVASKVAFVDFGNAAGSAGVLDTDITTLTGKAGLKVTVNGVLYGYIPVVTGS